LNEKKRNIFAYKKNEKKKNRIEVINILILDGRLGGKKQKIETRKGEKKNKDRFERMRIRCISCVSQKEHTHINC
jgi:hypothetical protein